MIRALAVPTARLGIFSSACESRDANIWGGTSPENGVHSHSATTGPAAVERAGIKTKYILSYMHSLINQINLFFASDNSLTRPAHVAYLDTLGIYILQRYSTNLVSSLSRGADDRSCTRGDRPYGRNADRGPRRFSGRIPGGATLPPLPDSGTGGKKTSAGPPGRGRARRD